MLCHAPATVNDRPDRKKRRFPECSGAVFQRAVPVSVVEPAYYGGGFGNNEAVVRANETYLRQDFSLMRKLSRIPQMAGPVCCFDYLIRTRTLTPEEAAERQPAVGEHPSASSAALSVLTRLTSTYLGNLGERDQRAETCSG